MPWYIGQSTDDGVVGEEDDVAGTELDAEAGELGPELALAGPLPPASVPPLLVQPARATPAMNATSARCLRITPVCATGPQSVS